MFRVYIINGPNIEFLKARNKDIYGSKSWDEIYKRLEALADELSISMYYSQSNYEGAIIDRLHEIYESEIADSDIYDANNLKINSDCGIIINAGAFTHTSYAIRDAIEMIKIPTIEVHISNIYAREDFRKNSVIAPVCMGQVTGFKGSSYGLAVLGLMEYWNNNI